MALNIYLIRHGRTVWNLEGRLQGSQDSPLIEEGILDAKATGKALEHIPFKACYSSMLKRAQDTANYIIGERHIPHFHHKGLNELNFGSWEGIKSVDLYDNPEYWIMKKTPIDYKAKSNGGETIEQLYQRANRTMGEIIAQHNDGDTILIVSHGMILTLITALLKGLSWKDYRDEEKHCFVLNTAINIAKIENGKTKLVVFNDDRHLK